MVLPKKIKTLPKFLSENDINKLLDYMQKNIKTFRDLQTLVLTEILYASGLRVSELVQLKVSSVADDLTHLYIKGKGNKDRVIPLGEYAQKVLKNYLLKIKLKYKNNPNKKKWLFQILILILLGILTTINLNFLQEKQILILKKYLLMY